MCLKGQKCLQIFYDFSADFYDLQVPIFEFNLYRLSAQSKSTL